MQAVMARLVEEHRSLEERLDALQAAMASGDAAVIAEKVSAAAELAFLHYLHEGRFLDRLALHQPEVAGKMTAQHEEACEAARFCEDAHAHGHTQDMLAMARRFLAMAQHNVIEEERDVFPLVERWAVPDLPGSPS